MDNKSHQEPLFKSGGGQDDSFYETIDRSSEYDNEINNSSGGAAMSPEEREHEQQELRKELAKLEEEITTLRSVLSTKQREAAHIKHKLGITPMTEMKADFRTGLTNIKESETVKKTGEALNKLEESITQSDAYQKTGQALKSLGVWSSKKLGDVRNSSTFKSFEEKVGGAYSSVRVSEQPHILLNDLYISSHDMLVF